MPNKPGTVGRTLTFKPQGKQLDILKAVLSNRYESIGAGGAGGGGKTFAAVFICWYYCMKYPGVRMFLGRKTLKDLKRTTLESYYKFTNEYDIPECQRGKFSQDLAVIEFENGSTISCLDLAYQPSDPDCNWLGSYEFTAGAIDESPQVDQRVIDILYSRINRNLNDKYNIKGFILEVGNPDKGHFYSRFYLREKNKTMPEESLFIKATAIDRLKHPSYFREHVRLHHDDEDTQTGIYIKSLLNRNERIQQRLLWGNFEYDNSPDRLIDTDEIYNAFENSLVPDGDKYITADIAGRGSDLYVAICWSGFRIIEVCEYEKTTGKENVEIINDLRFRYKVPAKNICYDADGIGGGIDGWIPGSISFINGGKPMDSDEYGNDFNNLASQCTWIMIDMIKKGFVFLNGKAFTRRTLDYISQEIDQQRQVDQDKDGPKKIIPKEKIKANIGRSPDYWDAIKMRGRFELKEKEAEPYILYI